jgi:pimeloyl-ACP methyl ester carboxylesterase
VRTTYAPKQTTTRGRTVQINNIEMYTRSTESEKPLVLVHGFGGCAENWHPFTAKLSERHRLIVVDLRGHGYSWRRLRSYL